MDKTAMLEQIIDTEWEMFQATNNKGGRASCQDDRETFDRMRLAQFAAWSDEAAKSYLGDLQAALAQGKNLVAEKYLHMMQHTHPAEYEAQKQFLPAIPAEKQALAQEICDEIVAQTVRLREAYPHVGMTGRPLYSSEDQYGTSVQTYQMGELLTYSENTLRLLRQHLFDLKAKGKSLAEEITSRSICSYGFSSLAEAESFLADYDHRNEE